MAVQIQLRRGTASQWTSTNPTLAAGEIAIETDTSKIKLGDGSTAWTSLAYFSAGSGDITGVDITAGDGLDISQSGTTSGDYTATVSADLKANGGLVIESTEIALKLDASNITGTLAIADGGTGATAAAMIGVITAVDAAAAQDVLGGTTVGKAVFVAADAAAARTAIGAGTGAGDLVAANNLSDLASASTARDNLELGTAAVLAVGISDTNVLQANAVVADNDFLRIDGTTVEGRSAADVLSDIGASPTAGNVSLVTTGTIGTGVWNATAILDTKIDLRVDHGVTFDGGGSVIESGKVVYVPVERAGVIKAATLVADASGAITITITKYDPDADATTLGSSAAVGSIALATKIINRDTTLSGWTLAVAEGDVLAFTTGGTIATVTRVTCKLKVELA